MKLFNCGLPKTGTSSLNAAFRILGIRSVHTAYAAGEFRDWCLNSQCREADAPKILEEYDAFGDGPFWTLTLDLLAGMPDCRVVITTRDKEGWITSMIVHVLANRVGSAGGVWKQLSTTRLEQTYERAQDIYHKALRQFPRRVLELNLPGGAGWSELCGFLDVPIPDVPFPRVNTSVQKLEAILTSIKSPQRFAYHGETNR